MHNDDLSTLLSLIITARENKDRLVSSNWAVADEMRTKIGSIKGYIPSEEQIVIIRFIMAGIQKEFGVEEYSYETIISMVKLSDATPTERRRGDQAFWTFIGLMAKQVGKSIVNQRPASQPTGKSPAEIQRDKDNAMLEIQQLQNQHIMQTAHVMDSENRKSVAENAELAADSSRRVALFLSQNGDEDNSEHLKVLHEALVLVRSGILKRSRKTQNLIRNLTEACQSWTKPR